MSSSVSTNRPAQEAAPFACPRCKQPSLLTQDNPFRPFCSERCKLIDLGSWAAEEHQIPGEDLGFSAQFEED